MGYELHRSVDELAPEWSPLAAATENVFATPEWVGAWWRHFGAGRRLLLASVRGADGLEGVLPLYLWRTAPRLARFLGHHAGDELGPICGPDTREVTAAALRELLAAERCAGLVGEQLPEEAGWGERLGATVLAREPSPSVPLPATWDEYLAGRSKNFRDQAKGRERKLARAHELRFRLADDVSLDRDLTTLFELHRARWREATNFGAREAFHRDVARIALERGWLRLWTLELDGEPAASWLGFRFGGAESYYQGGRRPELDRLSVGFVLMTHTIREAIAGGAREYRLLRGGEEYKARFAAVEGGLVTIVGGRGPLGGPVVAAAAGARGLRRAKRHLVERVNIRRSSP